MSMLKVNIIAGLIVAALLGSLVAFLSYRSRNPTPDNIVFMKYPGTNICFATAGWGTNLQTMATVPCAEVPEGKLHTFEGQ
jgi:hypothetical protein